MRAGLRFLLVVLACAAGLAAHGAGQGSANAKAAFERIKGLAGTWEGKDEHGMVSQTSLSVAAAGTAVIEKLEPHGMEEMVTLYSVDGDGVALVHFCPTNNQPRMRAVPASENVSELVFAFQGAGNLATEKTGHQNQLAIRFEDANHFTETWTWRENGKDTPMEYHFTRKKP